MNPLRRLTGRNLYAKEKQRNLRMHELDARKLDACKLDAHNGNHGEHYYTMDKHNILHYNLDFYEF